MIKIYIAGKITGNPNFKEQFAAAEEDLKAQGHAVINPAVLPDNGFEYEDYMHICYSMIDVCDGVYLLSNWQDSKGAKLEYEYAIASGKQIMFMAEQERERSHAV